MSETDASTKTEVNTLEANQALICLAIEEDTSPDVVAGLILRADKYDYEVTAEYTCGTENEAVLFADQLGAELLEVEKLSTHNLSQKTLNYAREKGYSTIIRVDPPICTANEHSTIEHAPVGSDESRQFLREIDSSAIHAVQTTIDKAQNTANSNSSSIAQSKDQERSVVAIVPAHNEEGTIRDVVERTKRYVDKVIVIDDGSTDSTADVASQCADGVVRHPENMGVGGAVDTGYQVAIREDHDIVIQIDGDGQHNPSYIPEMLATMEEQDVDMVIGSRWLNESYRKYSFVRRAGIRFFTLEANLLGDLEISDVTSGYRAYDADMLADLGRPDNSHWALEQTLEAARGGYEIEELSVPMPPETDGSQFTLDTLLRYPPRMILTSLKVLLFR